MCAICGFHGRSVVWIVTCPVCVPDGGCAQLVRLGRSRYGSRKQLKGQHYSSHGPEYGGVWRMRLGRSRCIQSGGSVGHPLFGRGPGYGRAQRKRLGRSRYSSWNGHPGRGQAVWSRTGGPVADRRSGRGPGHGARNGTHAVETHEFVAVVPCDYRTLCCGFPRFPTAFKANAGEPILWPWPPGLLVSQ
jgi:hypothetical protein